MNNISIVGRGMVGNATGKLFGVEKYFDLDESKSTTTMSEVAKSRFIFICLPTPISPGSTNYDLSDITTLIRQLEEMGSGGIYIIRSTVFPGYAMHLQKELKCNRVISNPEFLTESTWEKDIKNPPFVLLGGLPGTFMDEVAALYTGRLKATKIIATDNTTAELAKLAMNGYFSTKVIFANQIYDLAQSLGANYERIKEVLESHPFGPRNHFTVWFNGKRGVGGKCLPKDLQALAYFESQQLARKVMDLNQSYIHQKEL